MPVSEGSHLIPISSIVVEDRIRKEKGNIDELAASIDRLGLLQPIVVTRDHHLSVGERRLLACKALGRTVIEARYLDELTEHERRAVELEENLRRLNMTWQEEALGIFRYHKLRQEENEEWDVEDTANALGYRERFCYRHIYVARAIEQGNSDLLKCDTVAAANNMLERKHRRQVDAEVQRMLGASSPPLVLDEDEDGSIVVNDPHVDAPVTLPPEPEPEIEQADFKDWALDYDGPLFNVGHFDFPYGISHNRSDQGGSDHWETYEDSEDVFWDLCHTLKRCIQQGNVFIPNSHIIFWFSMKYYSEIRDYFEPLKDTLTIERFPLFWHKSDGAGILPDPNRGPRRTYETALFMTLGERPIVRAVANSFAHPARKRDAQHQSEKPIEVVKHFLRMVVDEYARVLDPTCGSGTALAAALSLGAQHIKGFDLLESNVEIAQANVNRMKLV